MKHADTCTAARLSHAVPDFLGGNQFSASLRRKTTSRFNPDYKVLTQLFQSSISIRLIWFNEWIREIRFNLRGEECAVMVERNGTNTQSEPGTMKCTSTFLLLFPPATLFFPHYTLFLRLPPALHSLHSNFFFSLFSFSSSALSSSSSSLLPPSTSLGLCSPSLFLMSSLVFSLAL